MRISWLRVLLYCRYFTFFQAGCQQNLYEIFIGGLQAMVEICSVGSFYNDVSLLDISNANRLGVHCVNIKSQVFDVFGLKINGARIVCKKLSTNSSQMYRFGSAVEKMNFYPSLASFTKPSSSNYKNIYSDRTQASHLVCARNFTVSNVKNEAEKSHGGDHTKLWSAERILAAGMLGVVPAALIFPSQPLDCLLALTLVMHSHWGIEAIVVDYVRPIIFGKTIPVVAHALVYVLSISTLTGLLFLIFNDCGFANAIHLLWKL